MTMATAPPPQLERATIEFLRKYAPFNEMEAEQEWRPIARREGVPQSEIELTMTYKGKSAQFSALCGKLASGEFLICEETCDKAFLEVFYDQARNQRFNSSGRSLIRFDDCCNVVSFSCDPAFAYMIPISEPDKKWSPFRTQEKEDYCPLDEVHPLVKTSIVMTLYDREPEVMLSTLRWLRSADLTDTEVIVVDDNSRIPTSYIPPVLERMNGRLVVMDEYGCYETHDGYNNPAKAFNRCLSEAQGEPVKHHITQQPQGPRAQGV